MSVDLSNIISIVLIPINAALITWIAVETKKERHSPSEISPEMEAFKSFYLLLHARSCDAVLLSLGSEAKQEEADALLKEVRESFESYSQVNGSLGLSAACFFVDRLRDVTFKLATLRPGSERLWFLRQELKNLSSLKYQKG